MNERSSSPFAAMSKEQLLEALEKHHATLQAIYQIIHQPNARIAPGEKLALIASQSILPQEKPNDKGLVRYPTNKVATFIGMSEGSAGRYANAVIERFGATKEAVEYITQKKQKRTLTYVNPTEDIWTRPWEAELPPDRERVINGNGRQCPICKTDNLTITTRRTKYQEILDCGGCGYHKVSKVLDGLPPLEPVEFIPQKIDYQAEEAFDEKGLQSKNLFCDADGEKGLQPEEPFTEKDEKSEALTSTQVSIQILESPVGDHDTGENQINVNLIFDVPLHTEIVDLPEFLRKKKIWACWRKEPKRDDGGNIIRDKKPGKVPYQPFGRGKVKASVSDPRTWGSYDQALKMYEESIKWGWKEPFDGIGLMCDGTFTVIDQDGCIVDGKISEAAAARLNLLGSYGELSPSQTGTHTIVEGNIPSGRKTKDIEMYDQARFLTWTGQHIVGTPSTIETRQEELTELYDQITPRRDPAPVKEMKPAPPLCRPSLWSNRRGDFRESPLQSGDGRSVPPPLRQWRHLWLSKSE